MIQIPGTRLALITLEQHHSSVFACVSSKKQTNKLFNVAITHQQSGKHLLEQQYLHISYCSFLQYFLFLTAYRNSKASIYLYFFTV